jgi:hypothetical protein
VGAVEHRDLVERRAFVAERLDASTIVVASSSAPPAFSRSIGAPGGCVVRRRLSLRIVLLAITVSAARRMLAELR